MRVTLEVPEDLVPLLGESAAGVSKAALEALALEGLRARKISFAQARRLLGIHSRYEMDGFLKAHEVFLPLTVEDVERDAATARGFRNNVDAELGVDATVGFPAQADEGVGRRPGGLPHKTI